MADPIVAQELRTRDFGGFDAYPKIFETPAGIAAVRFFSVNGVANEKDVLLALGLPAMWDGHPDLPATSGLNPPVVQRREIAKVGGSCFLVTIGYEPVTPGTSNPDDTAEDDTAFSEIIPTADQATVRADINDNAIPETTIEASKLEVEVTVYKSSIVGPLSVHLGMLNKVNANAVTFPPFRGFTERIVAAPSQLLARPMRVEPIGRGLVKLVIPFGIGPENCWRLRWTKEDQNGNPVQSSENELYPEVTFNTGALWT